MAWYARTLTALCISVLGIGAGCGMGSGDLGLTPGGSQDMRLARAIIEDGGIPTADQFTAEGLFSEHDFELPNTAACDRAMCPRATVARVEPVDGRGQRALLHLGFASNVKDFQRRNLNVAVAVDTSGSMSGSKLTAVKAALHVMVNHLDENDRMALIDFDSNARRRAWSTKMDLDGRGKMRRRIDRLDAGGGTDIEAGLEKAYKEVHRHDDGHGGREDRVMLFTDAQPNIGATSNSEFLDIVRAEANRGIGISVFGVGLDLGADLAREVSETRGGNSFYLSDLEAIGTVFDEDFDYIVSPFAYDVDFRIEPAPGFWFEEAVGVPDADASGDVDFSVATVFASSRGGAMAVVLEGELPDEALPNPVAEFSVTYETVDGELEKDSVSARWYGGNVEVSPEIAADHIGGLQLAPLYDEFLALSAAAEVCDGTLTEDEAIARIDDAASRLRLVGEALDYHAFHDEVELMEQLSANVAANGTCGGGYWYDW